MIFPLFSGERMTSVDKNFGPDLAQHVAMYNYVLPFIADKKVLDVGCGEGYGTYLLASTAEKVVGIDKSRETIKKASFSYSKPNLEFKCRDIYSLDFQEGLFDSICSFQVFEHLSNPEIFLYEISRIMKVGGYFFLSTPNSLTAFSENPYHLHEYTPWELEEVLKKFFSEVRIKGVIGNEKVRRFLESRRKNVNRFLRLDPFGIRKFIPFPIKKWAFGTLAIVVRKRIRLEKKDIFDTIVPADYEITDHAIEKALDTVAICKK